MAAAATLALRDELSAPGVHKRLNQYADELCKACQQVLTRHKIPAIAHNTGHRPQHRLVMADIVYAQAPGLLGV